MIQDHPVYTERIPEWVEVWLEGELIARTDNAIRVVEEGHSDVIYVPKNDIAHIDLLKAGEYHCPLKGNAELYTIKHGARDIENGAWSYEDPIPHFAELKGRVAFNASKIQGIKIQ